MLEHRRLRGGWTGAILAWIVVGSGWAVAQPSQQSAPSSHQTVLLPIDGRRPLSGYPGGYLWQGFFQEPHGQGPCGRADCATYGACAANMSPCSGARCGACTACCATPRAPTPARQAIRPTYGARYAWQAAPIQSIVRPAPLVVSPAAPLPESHPVYVTLWDEVDEAPSSVAFASVTEVDQSAVIRNPSSLASPPSEGTARLLDQLRSLADPRSADRER